MTKDERLALTVMYQMGQTSDTAINELLKHTRYSIFYQRIEDLREKDWEAERLNEDDDAHHARRYAEQPVRL